MAKVKKSKNHLVWIDLEMTGLDPKKHHILEIATIITDGNLNVLEEGPNMVINQPPEVLNKMDPWSQKQHQKTGLTDQSVWSDIKLSEAEDQTLALIKKYCPPKEAPLCGNAVHHDRRFLIAYMPKIDDYLHYRHVDVSSIKDLTLRWYPKEKRYAKDKDVHRSLHDIRESINELKHYQKMYFRTLEEVKEKRK